ncbi:MAG: hypothetical protein Q8Q59_02150 [Luteolibacter sp.]|nr:hypothetical protein [Luteolibacter sp.]
MKHLNFSLRWILLLMASVILCDAGKVMAVRDTKGRALDIELLSVTGESIRFKRLDTSKEFSVAIDVFDEDSQEKIRKEADSLPALLPPLDVEVVIGKRRQKKASYYMEEQEISCTVKLKNLSHEIPLPNLTGRVLFVGRNQRTPDAYTILSVQDFPVELKPGESSASGLKSFITKYDSDNKGYGNVGGYQYSGYLLVLLNDKQEVVFNQTTDGGIRKVLTERPGLLEKMAAYPRDAYFNGKLELQDQNLRPPNIIGR